MALSQGFRSSTALSTSRRAAPTARATRPCASRSARPAPRRLVVLRAGDEKKDKQPSFKRSELPHTGSDQPMSENKEAVTEEQMAAPEGDKAIIGESAQYLDSGATRPQESGTAPTSEGSSPPAENKQPEITKGNEALGNVQKALGVE